MTAVGKTLLDTDICSETLKGIDPTCVERAKAYRAVHPLSTVSTNTVMERTPFTTP
jgi:hypothetical protein